MGTRRGSENSLQYSPQPTRSTTATQSNTGGRTAKPRGGGAGGGCVCTCHYHVTTTASHRRVLGHGRRNLSGAMDTLVINMRSQTLSMPTVARGRAVVVVVVVVVGGVPWNMWAPWEMWGGMLRGHRVVRRLYGPVDGETSLQLGRRTGCNQLDPWVRKKGKAHTWVNHRQESIPPKLQQELPAGAWHSWMDSGEDHHWMEVPP
jgi:hypothetical protein